MYPFQQETIEVELRSEEKINFNCKRFKKCLLSILILVKYSFCQPQLSRENE